ncbi:hypothetical protein J4221_02195 [Candidatus Pacearchaeota archaeon]|nr:hypothetical protein [Candidatus Pacearchaeota archaeon]
MKKIIFIFLLVFLFIFSFIYAHGEEDFAQAEEIIKQKISCSSLSDKQLEILGDYYMEQMHPGKLHEIMDERMGGEGSESLKQVHITMGKAFYCGEHNMMSGGMMNMMMNRGMMYGTYNNYGNSYGFRIVGWVFSILVLAVLILLIAWLIKKLPRRKR